MGNLAAGHRVMVTGIGMWTPLGGLEDTWQGLLAGRSGVRRVAADAPWSQLVGVAGLAELPSARAGEFPSKAHGTAYLAASQALADAALSEPARSGTELLVGNNATEMDSDAKLALLARACPAGRGADKRTRRYPPEFGLAWLRDSLGLGRAWLPHRTHGGMFALDEDAVSLDLGVEMHVLASQHRCAGDVFPVENVEPVIL